jgi:hypothetical protein
VVVCESGRLDIKETSQTGCAAPCVLPIRSHRRVLKGAVVLRPRCVAERFRDSISIRACTVPKGPRHLVARQFPTRFCISICSYNLIKLPSPSSNAETAAPRLDPHQIQWPALLRLAHPSTFAGSLLKTPRPPSDTAPPYAADSSRVAVLDR